MSSLTLLSKGDYLKWYFKLRWFLACVFGFGFGFSVAASLHSMGLIDGLALPSRWGLLGLPIWVGLGFFQSQVLTDRICHRLRWVALTVLGGVAGMLIVALFSAFLPPVTVGGVLRNWAGRCGVSLASNSLSFRRGNDRTAPADCEQEELCPAQAVECGVRAGILSCALLSFPVGTVISMHCLRAI